MVPYFQYLPPITPEFPAGITEMHLNLNINFNHNLKKKHNLKVNDLQINHLIMVDLCLKYHGV